MPGAAQLHAAISAVLCSVFGASFCLHCCVPDVGGAGPADLMNESVGGNACRDLPTIRCTTWVCLKCKNYRQNSLSDDLAFCLLHCCSWLHYCLLVAAPPPSHRHYVPSYLITIKIMSQQLYSETCSLDISMISKRCN